MWGSSLWKVANMLPKGSLVVAVDPMTDRPRARDSLVQCIHELRLRGYNANFIDGDSTGLETIRQVRHFAPFDALFIDGNHSPEYVLADWTNYGPMARIIGFHDINWNNTWVSSRGNTPDETKMGAPKIWNQLKEGYRHAEFRFHPSQNYFGIGVLWRS
jgi:hypothetical protein